MTALLIAAGQVALPRLFCVYVRYCASHLNPSMSMLVPDMGIV